MSEGQKIICDNPQLYLTHPPGDSRTCELVTCFPIFSGKYLVLAYPPRDARKYTHRPAGPQDPARSCIIYYRAAAPGYM